MKTRIDVTRNVICALLVLLLLPVLVAGQERSLVPGERIRIRLSEQPRSIEGAAQPQLLRGSFVGFSGDTVLLRLHPAAGITAVAREGIDRLDVSGGVRSRFESAAVNGVTFALFGTIERVAWRYIDDDRLGHETTLESALIGAAGGALIGVTIGALFPQERWRRLRSWSK